MIKKKSGKARKKQKKEKESKLLIDEGNDKNAIIVGDYDTKLEDLLLAEQ